MKWKLVPTEVTHEMTSGVVLPGYDLTMAVRVFQSIVDHSPKASDDEELVEKSRVLLQYGHEYSFGESARAVLKILEGK